MKRESVEIMALSFFALALALAAGPSLRAADTKDPLSQHSLAGSLPHRGP